MEGYIRITEVPVIRSAKARFRMQDRMRFAELDKLLHIIGDIRKLSGIGPAHPSHRVVTAVGIVVAVLCVAEFIAGVNKRYALREQTIGKSIFYLLLSEFIRLFPLRRTFQSAVPAVILVGTIVVVLAVRLVMLFVVAHSVIERETVDICNIINNADFFRVIAHAPRKSTCHVLIPLEESTGMYLEIIVVERACSAFDLTLLSVIKIVHKNLGAGENRILQNGFPGYAHADHMEPVHMISYLPVPEGFQYIRDRCARCDIELHDALNPGLMQGLDKIPELRHRIVGCGKTLFRGEIIIAGGISPVVFLLRNVTCLCRVGTHDFSDVNISPEHAQACLSAVPHFGCRVPQRFAPLVRRHELDSCEPHLFNVRNLLHESAESTLVADTRLLIHGVSTNVKFIDDKVAELVSGSLVPCPVVFLIIYIADSVTDSSSIGIDIFFSTYFIVIPGYPGCTRRDAHTAHITDALADRQIYRSDDFFP